MPDARTPGKRGRLPARAAGERLALHYVHEYATALPPASYPVDVSAGITDWQMLGNGPDPACTTHPDGVGDCTFAGRQHAKMAKAAAGGETEQWETSDQLVAEYLRYDHGQDEGACIADLLLHWYKSGAILAFAPVDHTDPAAVDAAMQAFHGTYCGVSLTDDADQLFSDGQPWGTGSLTPDPQEGHCIVKVQAGDPAGGEAIDGWVTWGALQQSTRPWTAACLDEAWVLITSEDADAAGLDVSALRADIDALGGTGGTPADEPPAPEPVPVDPHRAELEEIIERMRAIADREAGTVVRFLRSHGF